MKDPGPGEVRVAIKAAGLCHSDLSVIDGTIPYPMPVVLGHEGAGIVEAVGAGRHGRQGRRRRRPLDARALRALPGVRGRPADGMPQRAEPEGHQPFIVGGKPAYQFANTSTFAERTRGAASRARSRSTRACRSTARR